MHHISLWVWLAASFVGWFLYGSFFEWWFHKYLFHSPKIVKRPFAHHTMIHHQIYKYEPASYEWHEPNDKDHITMDWWALPLFLVFHLPAAILFAFLIGQWWTIASALAAITAYYAIYEYFHFAMHVPGPQWFQQTRMFAFVKEHHRVHHKFMLANLNVFFPFADLIMGTYRTEASPARQDRSKGRYRDKAIARVKAAHTKSPDAPRARRSPSLKSKPVVP